MLTHISSSKACKLPFAKLLQGCNWHLRAPQGTLHEQQGHDKHIGPGHCRGSHEDATGSSAAEWAAGAAPPAPGLTRRPSKQPDHQEKQVTLQPCQLQTQHTQLVVL